MNLLTNYNKNLKFISMILLKLELIKLFKEEALQRHPIYCKLMFVSIDLEVVIRS